MTKRTEAEWLEFWRDVFDAKSGVPRERVWTPNRGDMLAVFAETVRREALTEAAALMDAKIALYPVATTNAFDGGSIHAYCHANVAIKHLRDGIAHGKHDATKDETLMGDKS